MKSASKTFPTSAFKRRVLISSLAAFFLVNIDSAMSIENKRVTTLDERGITSAALAEITFNTLTKCGSTNIVYAGRTMKGQFKGDWADYIKSVSVTAGRMIVTATLSNPHANFSYSTMDVDFSATTGASIEVNQFERHTLTIVVEPPFQAKFEKSFILDVFPPPILIGASSPTYNYFQTIQVKLAGVHLLGANKVAATVKVDSSHPLKSYAYEPLQISNGSPVPISLVGTSTSGEEIEVQLRFPQRLIKASVEISLTGDGTVTCSPFGSGPSTGTAPTLKRLVTLNSTYPEGAFVKSLDITNARLNRVADLTITLGESVPKTTAAMFVYWKMGPSNIFKGIPGDISYDPSGALNRTTMKAGESIKRFKLEVVSLPPGATDLGGTAAIYTWIGNKDTDKPPYFVQKAFTIAK